MGCLKGGVVANVVIPTPDYVRFVDIGLGVLLLALGAWLLLPRRTASSSPTAPTGAGKLLTLGVAMMVTNLSTLVMVVAGLREVVRADVDVAGELIAVGVLVAGALTPVLLPLGLDVVAPGPSRRLLDPAQRLVARHGTTIGVVVSLIFGTYLIGRGLASGDGRGAGGA